MGQGILRLRNMLGMFVRTLSLSISRQEALPFFVTLCAYFAAAKLGQFIFFNFQTAPAVIWPGAGIALAAILIKGYQMWLPIALGSLLAFATSPSHPSLPVVLISTFGHTLQPLIGAYFLRRLGFKGSFETTRDALVLILGAIAVSAIAPTISIASQWAMESAVSWGDRWVRSWAGFLLSLYVVTPLIITWNLRERIRMTKMEALETSLSFILLLASVYFLFWQRLPAIAFILLFVNFGALFWIALRRAPYAMTLALFLMTLFGVAGVLVRRSAHAPLNEQLLSTELFMLLIAPIFFVFTALIQERKSAERLQRSHIEELKLAMGRLNAEDKAKNEFIAILAHELRNPLAPVLNSLELLRLKSSDDETRSIIHNAEQQAHIMRRLLDDLLDIARVTQKRFKLQKETFELRTAIDQCVASIRPFYESRAHQLNISVPKETVWVYADIVRFEQIILNLLYNAGKYTQQGGCIDLTCVSDGGYLELSIKDNGIGIRPDELKHIYRPFRQVKNMPGVGTGLGIGLSLTKRLVEMHKGEIRAHSEGLGKGSLFTVKLPLERTQQMHMRGVKSPFRSKSRPPTGYGRVLVVDDNEAAARAISKLLAFEGYEVEYVLNGRDALRKATTYRPAAILLDIGLPDIDGYEVARRLRDSAIESKIIALTGYGQDEDKLKVRKAGFDKHMVKPVDIVELESVLR